MTDRSGDLGTPALLRASVAGLVMLGGGLGVAGVAVSAAAAHAGGGSGAMTAGQFCLFHAAAVLGLAGTSPIFARPRLAVLAALVLVVGTVLFAGDLALAGLAGMRPFPPAAPIGGSLLLAGWCLVIVTGLLGLVSQRCRNR